MVFTIPANSGVTSINVIRCQANGTTITADAQYKYYQVEEGVNATDFVDGTRSQNTNWVDLSGNSNDATLASAVGMDPGGWITFNGTQTTAYQVAVPIDRTELGDKASVEAIFRYDGASGDSFI